MQTPLALALGVRYAFSRRSSLSFVSLIALGGLALSVAVLVVVVSVVNGFERELETRVFGILPHVMLQSRGGLTDDPADRDQLSGMPGVRGVAPFVQGAGLAAGQAASAGVLVWGIDPAEQGAVSDYARYLEPAPRERPGDASAALSTTGLAQTADARAADAGATGMGITAAGAVSRSSAASPDVDRVPLAAGEFEAIVGARLAARLGIVPGDPITLILPTATVTPAGLFPRQKRFRVTALLRSQSEIDGRAVLIHVDDARRLFRLGRSIHGYQLALDDLFRAEEVAREGTDRLGRDRVYPATWMRTHGNLYHAIAVQKSTMFLLLSFLVGVAAFNLVSTLVMIVNQRSGDVAILRTLGASSGMIMRAFVLLGLCIGAVGVLFGAAVGTLVAVALPGCYTAVTAALGIDLMSQYFVNYLPVQVRLDDLTGIVVTAFGLCAVSTLYPAWRAARLEPARVLAHE